MGLPRLRDLDRPVTDAGYDIDRPAESLNVPADGVYLARFRLVPHLAKAVSVPVPPFRKPGSVWTELSRPAVAGTAPAEHVRIGYARASTVRQSLDAQTDPLKASGVTRVFAEKISTRAVTRPELDRATSRPAPAAWPSAARLSPTKRCSPRRCTCAGRS